MQEEAQNSADKPEEALAAEAGSASGTGPAAAGSAPVDSEQSLKEALAAAQSELKEHYEAYLRARAESENVRRRAEEDIAKARKFGLESFAENLLPVMDSLEAALGDTAADSATLRAGVEATQRQLAAAFERNRLTVIDPLHQKFDPHRHQAINMQPSGEVAPNHVIAVLQKGWMISDRVLRPALVTVAQAG
jgi:molecular chaperone GrpE